VKVAVGSDERTAVTDAVVADLAARGHDVVLVGPLADQPVEVSMEWAEVGLRVGALVAAGECDTGVVCCWTGTGVSIAANKVDGVRAALCADVVTVEGARRWNDANVLALGLQHLEVTTARAMLGAWFTTDPDPGEAANVARLDRGSGQPGPTTERRVR